MNTTFADYREPFPNVGIARDDNGVTGDPMHTDGATQHFGRRNRTASGCSGQ